MVIFPARRASGRVLEQPGPGRRVDWAYGWFAEMASGAGAGNLHRPQQPPEPDVEPSAACTAHGRSLSRVSM
jgi:hypothetical protein